MDAEDCELLRDIALIDEQLQIGTSTNTISTAGYEVPNQVIEESTPTTSTAEFSIPKEFNSSCQEVLKNIEKRLLEVLQENREKQKSLTKYLNESGKKSESEENSVWKIIKCAGIPYFKDFHGYPQPRNDDVKEKLSKRQLCCMDFFTLPHMWNQQSKECLKKAVLKELEKGESKNCEKKFQGGRSEISIDWLKISATDLNGKYSPRECESQWKLHLAPEINKGKWTKSETDKLNIIVKKRKGQDWDKIASELGTGRTGFQCCIQYQTKNSLNEGKWSQEEDSFLQELVEKYSRNNHVPWTKISWYFQTRSRKQCQERYLEHLKSDLKKGFFSNAEDKIIISGVKIFKDFGKIARFLPGRAPTQIRSRYYYLTSTSMSQFTKEEDGLLLSLVKQHPQDWQKISQNFQNKSKIECKKRYGELCKEVPQNQGENQEIESSNDAREKINLLELNKRKVNIVKGNKKGKKKSQAKTKLKVKQETNNVYNEIVEYHSGCSENYFGPRMRNPPDQNFSDICSKLRATMAMLSVSPDFSDKSPLINSLENNCNFDSYDIKVLNNLCEEDKEKGPYVNDNYLLDKSLIPPNYSTLIGLNSLMTNKGKIKHRTCEAEGLPSVSTNEKDCDSEITGERLSFSRAKALFQSRLKSLFHLPLMLSLVPTNDIHWEVYQKGKRKKPKKLSKKQLKAHAKNMSNAYQEKRRREKEAVESQNEGSQPEEECSKPKRSKKNLEAQF